MVIGGQRPSALIRLTVATEARVTGLPQATQLPQYIQAATVSCLHQSTLGWLLSTLDLSTLLLDILLQSILLLNTFLD